MKKTLIAVTAVLLLVTTSAFADITMGAWLRTVFAPVASDGENNYTDMVNSWGGVRQSRINVAGTAADDLAGFKADFYINNGDVGVGDNAYIWVKPIDMIKVAYGKFDSPEAGFRGDLCYGSWDWIRPSFVGYDEGLTFSGNGSGAMVNINPIENLSIYALAPIGMKDSALSAALGIKDSDVTFPPSGWTDLGNNVTVTVEEEATKDFQERTYMVYGNSEIAAAYTIDGIGKIKAGYFGKYKKSGDYERLGNIEAAFDLTAVENLYVTAGFRYALGDKEVFDVDTDLMKIALGASYQIMDGFKVSASGLVYLYESDTKRDPAFIVGAGVDYAIMDGLTLNADVRYKSETSVDGNGEKDDGISFLVGVDKTVGSNGSIGLGFQGVTNGQGFINTLQKDDNFAWAIPVKVQVSF